MDRFSLAAAALLAAAGVSASELPLDRDGLTAVDRSLSALQEKQAPAPVDKSLVDKLFARLAKDGPTYRRQRTTKEGEEVLSVTLVEVAPPQEGEDDGVPMVQDLVYRRYFSSLTGVQQNMAPLPNGEVGIDTYEYTVSLDGRLLAVKRTVMVVVGATPAGDLVMDKSRMKVYRLAPKDPSVLKRWREMSQEFLKMGRTASV